MSYTCPMHLEIEEALPGFCPICGMDLEPKQGGPSREGGEYRAMRWRFWLALGLTALLLLVMHATFLPAQWGLTPYEPLLQLLITTPIVFVAGWPFFQRAFSRSLNMFSLIALGMGSAYCYSAIVVLLGKGTLYLYFEAAAMITLLVLLGQVLELKARGRTSHALQALLERGAKRAHLVEGNQERDLAAEEVKVGDLLRVKPGEKIPVDGEVIEGSSFVDESMITGEPAAIKKMQGSLVIGSTINQQGSFLMQAKRVGSETLFAQIVEMVAAAQRTRAPIQRVADRISAYFVPSVLLVASLTFVGWLVWGPEPKLSYALVAGVSVLIIACPCALGLATPLSIMVGVGKGAESGILMKDAESLEKLETIDTLVIDKTGTLTEGRSRVTQILALPAWEEEVLLKLAASIAQNSEHPLAGAIVQVTREKGIALVKGEEFIATPGQGMRGLVEGKSILIGKYAFLLENQVKGIEQALKMAAPLSEAAKSLIFMAIEGAFVALIVAEDPMKPSAAHAVQRLHQKGIKVVMLTGDNHSTAQAIGTRLGIDEVYSEVDPQEKHLFIEKLRKDKKRVAMAGDGINDAPALAAADVGIAMGTGSDIAIESAGITLLKGDLVGIAHAIDLSRATMRNIRQNLFFAFIYNSLAIPIAAGLLYPFFAILLNPVIASAAMACSSLSVVLNALRLKNLKLK